jgi:tetratricopeptide (TPR) repeat protein
MPCTEAIRLDPDYADAYNNRGIAYRRKRDLDRAIANYAETIRLDPDYYNRLNKDNEKLISLCILNCYKIDNKFDGLLKLMEENNVNYTFEQSKY